MALARIATIDLLNVTPPEETVQLGTTQRVTATVTDANGSGVAGARVDFHVAGANRLDGFEYTNAPGQASFRYFGAALGSDNITATVGTLTETATKTWIAAPPTLQVDAPVDGSEIAAATTMLVTGHAFPGHRTAPLAAVRDFDGISPDGIPYDDFSSLVDDGTLSPDELTERGVLAFHNPLRLPFTYDLVLLGQLNRPPAFTTSPSVSVMTDTPYQYAFSATDPDGNPESDTLAAGPAGLTIPAGTTNLTWTPTGADVGNHTIVLQTDNGRGGRAVQPYQLTVYAPPPNRPPVFTTVRPATA